MLFFGLSCVYLLNWEGSETLVKNSRLMTLFFNPRDSSVLLSYAVKTLQN